MRPERDAVGAVVRIAEGVVVMIVRVERSLDRYLTEAAQRLHLEAGARGGSKALNQQGTFLSDKEAAITNGSESLGSIGNRSVKAVADFANGGETLICDH